MKEKKAVEFHDHNGNQYALFLQAPPVLVKDDVIKLRCVDVTFTKEGRVIGVTANSSCLIVPNNFFDSRLFTKNAKLSPMIKTPTKLGKSGKNTPLTTKRALSASYPFLEYYNYEEHLLANPKKSKKGVSTNQVTLIKKKYIHKVPTPISELLNILESPKQYEHQRFVISGYIIGFSETKLNKIVKKMDPKTKKVYGFNDSVKTKNLKHIYHFILFMKDQSSEDSDKILNAYVLTNEGDQHLFDLWNTLPAPDQTAKWENLSKKEVSGFEKKFKGLKNLENKVNIVVELLITGQGRPFFKLYDTIFLN